VTVVANDTHTIALGQVILMASLDTLMRYNWFQNLFCSEIKRKAHGQGPRRKGLGSVLKHVENSFCRERRSMSFAANRSRKRF